MKTKFSCAEVEDKFHAYLDNMLSDDERKLFEEHLDHCLPCDKKIDFEVKLKEVIRCKTSHDPVPVRLQDELKKMLSS
jgi:mycothiol system anti-sigma-R factor